MNESSHETTHLTAFVFPGQGSQAVGMGIALAAAYPEARDVFQRVDEALSFNLFRLMTQGPDEDLTLTEYAQPALMASSLAVMAVLERQLKVTVRSHASFVAGHSLGEYAALAASGALRIEDCAKILRQRGRAMQNAVPAGIGTMAAILGLELAAVEAIVKELDGSECVDIANDNSEGQVVISGHKNAVDAAISLAQAKGAKRAILLPVSAPFHSRLMAPAAHVMRDVLESADIQTPCVPLVANVTAQPVTDPAIITQQLVEQVTGRVRWRESVGWMHAHGKVARMVEIGTGKVLCGLIRRIAKDVETLNIETPQDVEMAATRLSQ
jgi:[acyl-carrier-protein] S-malonyltransferase